MWVTLIRLLTRNVCNRSLSLCEMSFDSSTSGSRSSGDPAVVWAVMSAVTARNQSLLTPRSHRPGARRLIAGRTAVSALLPSQPPWLNLLCEDTQVIPRLRHYCEDWRRLFTAGGLQGEEECQHRPSSAPLLQGKKIQISRARQRLPCCTQPILKIWITCSLLFL